MMIVRGNEKRDIVGLLARCAAKLRQGLLRYGALLVLCAFAAMIVQPTTAEARDARYRLVPGDTLWALERRFLASGRTWRDITAYNRIPDASSVLVGRIIRFPVAWLRQDPQIASLGAFRGQIDVAVAKMPLAPAVGMRLPSNSTVSTGARSFASIRLPDQSTLAVMPESRVRLTTLTRAALTGEWVRLIDVQQGRLEAKVAPKHQPEEGFRIRTPLAVASVRGTEFRTISADRLGQTRVEVLQGTVAVSGTDQKVLVQGEGLIATRQGLGAIEKLAAPPELVDPGRIQDAEMLTFAIRPENSAVGWHVTVAADAGFIDRLDEAVSDNPRVVLAGPPGGTYFVRIAAISPTGVEGLSRDYAFRRDRYRFASSVQSEQKSGREFFRFLWTPATDQPARFRFVLRKQGSSGAPLVDEPGLTSSELVLTDLPSGTYRWRVGRWSHDGTSPAMVWDDEHELVISR